MENQERVEVNSVTYSADAQREMDAIVAKYVKQDAPKQETALDRMQKLDRAAESKAQIVGLAVGIVAALVLGLAIVLSFNWMIPGMILGCCGIAVMAAMPAAYERLLKRERKKVAPQIVELIKKAESSSREAS